MKTRVLISRILAFCVIALVSVVGLSAQSFTVELIDPSPMLMGTSEYPEHRGTLTNNTAVAKNVGVRYYKVNKSANHQASLCTDVCRTLPDDFFEEYADLPVFPLAANASMELKTLLHSLGYEGTSTLKFIFHDADNIADSAHYSVTFIVDSTTTVKDISDVADVVVAPNPSSDRVTLSSSILAQATSLVVYAADGRNVRSQAHDGSQRIVVDVSTLSVGSYHVILTLTSGAVYRTPISVVR